jgi:hypothetical protein
LSSECRFLGLVLGFTLLIGLGIEMYSRRFGWSVGVGRRIGHADESWGGHVILVWKVGKLEGNILPVWCFGESGCTVYRSGYLRKARLL